MQWTVFYQQHCELRAAVFQVSAASSCSVLCSQQQFWGPRLSGYDVWAGEQLLTLLSHCLRNSGHCSPSDTVASPQKLPADIPAVRFCTAFLNATFKFLWCCCITSCVLKTEKALWWVRWWFSFTKMRSVVYTLPKRHVSLPEQPLAVEFRFFYCIRATAVSTEPLIPVDQ